MTIDYQNGVLTNKTVLFEGETKDGKTFTITANWNESDDWECDDIMWHDESGSEDDEENIRNTFISEMNNWE